MRFYKTVYQYMSLKFCYGRTFAILYAILISVIILLVMSYKEVSRGINDVISIQFRF